MKKLLSGLLITLILCTHAAAEPEPGVNEWLKAGTNCIEDKWQPLDEIPWSSNGPISVRSIPRTIQGYHSEPITILNTIDFIRKVESVIHELERPEYLLGIYWYQKPMVNGDFLETRFLLVIAGWEI